MIEQFHFIRPYFLLLFFALAWIVWMAMRAVKKGSGWTNVCDPGLINYLLIGTGRKSSKLPVVLMLVAGCLIIFALAGPTWQKLPQPVYNQQSATVYLLDLSRSMYAADTPPSRISRARLKLIDLLQSQKEAQVALIVFAGQAHVVSPLTDDANTIVAMVPTLEPDIMPAQGSRTDLALNTARRLLKQAGYSEGDIVLLADGVNAERSRKESVHAVEDGFRVNVIGVGTEQGAPIPVSGGGFLKDNDGGIVVPKLDRTELKEIALAGSGKYFDLAVDDSDVKALMDRPMSTKLEKERAELREVDLWRDQGHWLALFCIPLVALGFRRGWLGIVLVSLLAMPDEQALAFEWQDLWKSPDQQAQTKLREGDAKGAAEKFRDPMWKGSAYYRDGNYEKAMEYFSSSDDLDSQYNLGNAYAKSGKLEEALAKYSEVLEKNPKHTDAKFNKELVEKLLKQQESQQSQNSQNNDQQQDNSNQDSQQQENSDQSSESNQQNADSQENSDKKQEQSQADAGEDSQNQEKSQEQKQNNEQRENDQQKGEEKSESIQQAQQQETDEQQNSEQKEIQQATEQWLRRIPDDPGGLLREKLLRQYMKQRQKQQAENAW